MKTEVCRLDGAPGDEEALNRAVELLRSGAAVAFPTDTVYGLGADASNPAALANLYEIKGRPPNKPFALLVPSVTAAEQTAGGFSRAARKLARLYWPGPLTLVVPRRGAQEAGVGLRLPEHPLARALPARAGFPLATPSANRSGSRDPVTAADVLAELEGRIPLILDGGAAWGGKASTVVQVEDSGTVKVLRAGPIAEAELQAAVKPTILFVCTGNTCRSPMAMGYCLALLHRLPHPAGAPRYRVLSAGTAAWQGRPADPLTVEVMREVRVDLSAHRTRAVHPSLLGTADWICVMTRAQRDAVVELMPECRDRVRLLSPDGVDLPDPAGRNLDFYRRVRDRVGLAVNGFLRNFRAETPGGPSAGGVSPGAAAPEGGAAP